MTDDNKLPEKDSNEALLNPFLVMSTTGDLEVVKGGAPEDPAKESKESK